MVYCVDQTCTQRKTTNILYNDDLYVSWYDFCIFSGKDKFNVHVCNLGDIYL